MPTALKVSSDCQPLQSLHGGRGGLKSRSPGQNDLREISHSQALAPRRSSSALLSCLNSEAVRANTPSTRIRKWECEVLCLLCFTKRQEGDSFHLFWAHETRAKMSSRIDFEQSEVSAFSMLALNSAPNFSIYHDVNHVVTQWRHTSIDPGRAVRVRTTPQVYSPTNLPGDWRCSSICLRGRLHSYYVLIWKSFRVWANIIIKLQHREAQRKKVNRWQNEYGEKGKTAEKSRTTCLFGFCYVC